MDSVRHTRYSRPFDASTDPLAWLHDELPNWPHGQSEPGQFWAQSPTFAIDGIRILASDPVELVERVRAFERLIALAADRAGRMPVGRTVGGRSFEERTDEEPRSTEERRAPSRTPDRAPRASPRRPGAQGASVPGAPRLNDPTGLGAPTGLSAVEVARAKGYSGDPCTTCGSLDTRYSGTCLVCDNCGATSGCN